MRLLLIAPLFMLAGCVGETSVRHVVTPPHPYYSFCVVTTAHQDIEEQVADRVSPFFQIATHADVRAKGAQADTLVVKLKGERGLQGAAAIINLESFTGELLSQITIQRGFFYGGFESALKGALARLPAEVSEFSAKQHPPQ